MPKRKTDEQYEQDELRARHREDERPPIPEGPPGSAGGDVHAMGAWGGGTAVGGLAGSNEADGSPNIDAVEEAAGSGNFDQELAGEGEPPYAGHAGGAVGGTPAGKRSGGGRIQGGITADGSHRGDSTIGDDPPSVERRR